MILESGFDVLGHIYRDLNTDAEPIPTFNPGCYVLPRADEIPAGRWVADPPDAAYDGITWGVGDVPPQLGFGPDDFSTLVSASGKLFVAGHGYGSAFFYRFSPA